MRVTINGEERDIPEDSTILSVLESLGIAPKTVVAQVNDDVVERKAFAEAHLRDGDRVDFIRFVGGG